MSCHVTSFEEGRWRKVSDLSSFLCLLFILQPESILLETNLFWIFLCIVAVIITSLSNVSFRSKYVIKIRLYVLRGSIKLHFFLLCGVQADRYSLLCAFFSICTIGWMCRSSLACSYNRQAVQQSTDCFTSTIFTSLVQSIDCATCPGQSIDWILHRISNTSILNTVDIIFSFAVAL